MRALGIDDLQIDLNHENLRLIHRTPHKDLTRGIRYETLAPELNTIPAIRRLMTDTVRSDDVAPIGDGVPALNSFP